VRVAVVGTIIRAKGYGRLLQCARDARARRLPLEFHIFGSTERDDDLERVGNVHVTGPYREQEIDQTLADHRCHLVFLPSLCPETYMYTLSIVMAAGFYVVCFDLGAQAERLRAWGWAGLLTLDTPTEAINDFIVGSARRLATAQQSPPPPDQAAYPDLLRSYYDFSPGELVKMGVAKAQRPIDGGAIRRLFRIDRFAHLHRPHGTRFLHRVRAGRLGKASPPLSSIDKTRSPD